MSEYQKTAVIGAGVIGASWAALFLASGRDVAVHDPVPGAEEAVRRYIDEAWPTLLELGLATETRRGVLSFHATAAEAVAGADFIQESVPERIAIKHALYAEIEPVLKPGAIVASSASGLTLGEMQAGWKDPSPFVLGHPFNPPHLIPLVEVMGNDHTRPSAVTGAEEFYKLVGKITIRVNREVPGHVANRLQAALWREAIHLVKTGVASVEDVDKAVWAGPGLRWAAMGPTMLFHLGAGEGGLAAFCERYTDSFNRWWDDLGVLHLDPSLSAELMSGVQQESRDQSPAELSSQRDALITAMQRATASLRAAS
ncbi:3-hydroxyacyl-CoA dehydrogenase NAD-binding domain-containing protein [Paracoccus yeei]|uniref:3-hydroxyacyl-CoA dehydrogenase n=1 Tax=Paracoccus yeei TaxID=147645 RepID=A0A2D2C1X3_9RHOB|nr:3-hydroxyacyl-CoA dehydrogenase NAD-binding domain-containing protein [Paracoccus yeei]ATQ56399.1 3-hydroxyacyl-CoA dehydrogenase [Paracoccus yeei]